MAPNATATHGDKGLSQVACPQLFLNVHAFSLFIFFTLFVLIFKKKNWTFLKKLRNFYNLWFVSKNKKIVNSYQILRSIFEFMNNFSNS